MGKRVGLIPRDPGNLRRDALRRQPITERRDMRQTPEAAMAARALLQKKKTPLQESGSKRVHQFCFLLFFSGFCSCLEVFAVSVRLDSFLYYCGNRKSPPA